VDVRVLSATNRDPDRAVAEGRLREDLLYRLNVFPLELPPLRRRADDVRLLAQGFLDRLNRRSGTMKRLTESAVDRLRGHPWPGNVRELKNVIERAFIMAAEEIGEEDLPLDRRTVVESDGQRLTFSVGTSLSESERALILATLDAHDGNKREAAKILGVSLKTLYNRLKEYETASK
jgi:DNA-binding NtrC family response regulator